MIFKHCFHIRLKPVWTDRSGDLCRIQFGFNETLLTKNLIKSATKSKKSAIRVDWSTKNSKKIVWNFWLNNSHFLYYLKLKICDSLDFDEIFIMSFKENKTMVIEKIKIYWYDNISFLLLLITYDKFVFLFILHLKLILWKVLKYIWTLKIDVIMYKIT